MPEGIIPEEDIRFEEELNKELMEIPGMKETQQRLKSTLLEDKNRYYHQADIIINCLREVFGDYNENLLNITNDLLYEIGDFMDAHKELEEGSDSPKKYKHLKLHYKSKKIGLRSYLSDYGQKYFNKLREENPSLSEKELSHLRNQKKNEFIDLLIQNLEYVPPKEDNE